MTTLMPLMPLVQREWLQHRKAWALVLGFPLLLGLLLVGFADVEFSDPTPEQLGLALPELMTMAASTATAAVLFLIVWATALLMTTGLPRRDHADRSAEFWLSLPVGHASSLGVPLVVHLVLVPAAALLVGLLGGYVISAVLVSRLAGVAAWLGLPWGQILAATTALAARVLAGLPLATLWLAPLIMLAMLAQAYIGRWGVPLLAVGLLLGSMLLEQVFGLPQVSQALDGSTGHAATSLLMAGGVGFNLKDGQEVQLLLQGLPAWAWNDWLAALRNAVAPQMAAGLVVAAACFAALVDWRRRGGGLAG